MSSRERRRPTPGSARRRARRARATPSIGSTRPQSRNARSSSGRSEFAVGIDHRVHDRAAHDSARVGEQLLPTRRRRRPARPVRTVAPRPGARARRRSAAAARRRGEIVGARRIQAAEVLPRAIEAAAAAPPAAPICAPVRIAGSAATAVGCGGLGRRRPARTSPRSGAASARAAAPSDPGAARRPRRTRVRRARCRRPRTRRTRASTRGSSTPSADSYHRLGQCGSDRSRTGSCAGSAWPPAPPRHRTYAASAGRDVEAEATVAPAERERRAVGEQVLPPAVARSGDRGERIVVGGGPRLVGEEALEQLLQRRELVEIDPSERVPCQVRDRLGSQTAFSDSRRTWSRASSVTAATVRPRARTGDDRRDAGDNPAHVPSDRRRHGWFGHCSHRGRACDGAGEAHGRDAAHRARVSTAVESAPRCGIDVDRPDDRRRSGQRRHRVGGSRSARSRRRDRAATPTSRSRSTRCPAIPRTRSSPRRRTSAPTSSWSGAGACRA